MPWSDSISGKRPERAGLTDAWQNLADSAAKTLIGKLLSQPSDNWGNLADSVLSLRKGLLKPTFTDNWQNLSDSISNRLRYLAKLQDDLNLWNDSAAKTLTTGATPKTFAGTDTWANLADSAALRRGLKAVYSDSWNNLSDNIAARYRIFARFTDDINLLADFVAKTLTTGSTPKTFSGTDGLNNWADTRAAFLRLRASVSENAFNLSDSIAFLYRMRAGLSDNAANLGDLLLPRRGLLLRFTDNLNFWTDAAARTLGVGKIPKTFSGTDNLSNWNDVRALRLGLNAVYTDDASGIADNIKALRRLRANLSPESIAFLNDILHITLIGGSMGDAYRWIEMMEALNFSEYQPYEMKEFDLYDWEEIQL